MSHAIDPDIPPGLPATPGSVVTVGTFDGMHRGHWKVLEAVRRRAEDAGMPAVLATFHPHPLRVVRPHDAPPLLTTPREKTEILAESGLDYAVFLPFTEVLRSYPPERFVEEILIGRLRMRQLVIGYDHGFGRGRSGDVETLRGIGARVGFGVEVVEALEVEGGAISSSRIRAALAEGRVEDAAAALGRPYSISGRVVRGEGRGRGLGFPTANIHIGDPDKLIPREGVYAVTATIGGRSLPGVLHHGPRPQFEGTAPSVELHLLDFDRDLYGRDLRVEFRTWLREIRKFESVDALIDAIRGDCDRARTLLDAVAAR